MLTTWRSFLTNDVLCFCPDLRNLRFLNSDVSTFVCLFVCMLLCKVSVNMSWVNVLTVALSLFVCLILFARFFFFFKAGVT